MNNICKCCGEKIGFMDVGWDYITIEGTEHKICGNCIKKISEYKKGISLLEDVITEKTEEGIVKYIKTINVGDNTQKINEERKQVEKKNLARQNNPLYDDKHQIAGDLRFIKNLIIIGLIASFILGLIFWIPIYIYVEG